MTSFWDTDPDRQPGAPSCTEGEINVPGRIFLRPIHPHILALSLGRLCPANSCRFWRDPAGLAENAGGHASRSKCHMVLVVHHGRGGNGPVTSVATLAGEPVSRWIFGLHVRLSAIRTCSVLAGAVNSPLERASAGTGLLLGLHSVLRAKGRAVAAAGPIAGYRAPCLPALGKPTHGKAPGQY